MINVEPTESLAEILVDPAGAPGLRFLVMRHDAWCPAIESQRATDCRCKPIKQVMTEAGWAAAVATTRSRRRKAAREAAKAVRKARKGGHR